MSNTSKMDKEYLTEQVTAFQNGDDSAFGEVYRLIADKLLRYAMMMTKDHMEAEDLLQDTMVEIVKSIGKLRDTSAFTTWSVQIMRNVYSHKMRKTSDVVARDDSDLELFESIADEDMSYRPDIAAEEASVSMAVKAEMDKLPEAQRTAMVAFYYDGMSVGEISEMMGVSDNTTKSRLFAGRKAMKLGIEKYEKSTGVRIHEFAPAPIIISFMHNIFAGTGIVKEEVLLAIFKRVVEATGIAASIPSDPANIDFPEAEAEPTPDDAPDIPEPDTESAPEDTSDMSEPDTGGSPDESPDVSEPDTGSSPDESPDVSEPDTGGSPDESPEMPEQDSRPSPNDTSEPLRQTSVDNTAGANRAVDTRSSARAARAEKNRQADRVARNIKQARRASRAANLGRRALMLKILAGLFAFLAMVGISVKVALPFIDSLLNGSETEVSEYGNAYLSALHLHEEDINEYTWQFKKDFADAQPEKATKPVAFKDIDGDGVPEMFFMSASVVDYEVQAYGADLHIFTYKNGSLQELRYEYDYPSDKTPEYYDQLFSHYGTDHDGRMVHYMSWKPNTSFAVFKSSTEDTFYILSFNWGSETGDFRVRKYSMENDGDKSRLAIASDTYRILTRDGNVQSQNPDSELEAAVNDMDEILIYGGYGAGLGQPPIGSADAVSDAEKNGWINIQSPGNESGADIAPEKFQNSLCMSFDEAVALLQEMLTESKSDESDRATEYIEINIDGRTSQLGNKLVFYDSESATMKGIKIGDVNAKRYEMGAYGGSNWETYTNGNSIVYLDNSEFSIGETYPVPLIKHDMETGTKETLIEFEGTPDPNAGYHLEAVNDGVAYIGFTSGDGEKLWACDLESGELSELKEQTFIRESSDNYVLTSEWGTLSSDDVLPADIYELSGSELKHVAKLGDNISVATDVIDGKFYYAESADKSSRDVSVNRCNADGSNAETLARFASANENSILVEKYGENFCEVRIDGVAYKYIYEDDRLIPME